MFVIEKLVRDHEAKQASWVEARDRWIAKNEYYSRSDYEDRHPRPGYKLKLFAKSLLIFVLVAAVVGTVISVSVGAEHHTKSNKPKTSTAQKKDSTPIKVGDKVQVVYGDYINSVGVVIRVGNSDAIIKLTNSTLTHAMCNASSSCSSGGGKDNGELLGISDTDNLVPYKEVK